MKLLKIFTIIYITAFSTCVLSKDLYVSPTGNDSIAYEEVTISAPWKTLIHAIYNLKAGDILFIRAGIYKPTHPLFLRDTFTSQNKGGHPTEKVNSESGTPGAPVTITNYNNEKVIVDLFDTKTFITIDNIDYWTIENLIILNTGSAFVLAVDGSADNIVFRNLYIRAIYGGDNSANIKVNSERATNITIQNNYLVGPGTGPSIHLNTAAVFARRTDSISIINNQIENAPFGIYYKHANPLTTTSNIIIRNNYILNTYRSPLLTNSNGALIENNIFGPNNRNMVVNEASGSPGGDHNKILHNTFYGATIGLSSETQTTDTSLPGAINNQIKNNIFFISDVFLHQYSSLPHNTTSNFNLYNTGVNIVQDRVEYALSDWQSLTSEDSDSLTGTPAFISNDNQSLISSFELAPDSIGKKSAEDGSDIGANVTTVGPNIPIPNFPKSPTNVEAQRQ